MIEFKINNKYEIKDITVGRYYEIQDKLILSKDRNKQMEIVSSLSDCPLSELKQLDIRQFETLWHTIFTENLSQLGDNAFHQYIELNGKKYKFIDMNKLTIGELADMDILNALPNKERQLHKMLAILYRPYKKKIWGDKIEPYKADTMEMRATEFLDLPMSYVFGAFDFFLQLQKISFDVILNSWIKKTKNKKEKTNLKAMKQNILELHEIGTKPSLSSVENLLSISNEFKEQLLSELSTTYHIEKTELEKKLKQLEN